MTFGRRNEGAFTGPQNVLDFTQARSRREVANTLLHRANANKDAEMTRLLKQWVDIISPADPHMQTGTASAPSQRTHSPENVIVGKINKHLRENPSRYPHATFINIESLRQKEVNVLTAR